MFIFGVHAIANVVLLAVQVYICANNYIPDVARLISHLTKGPSLLSSASTHVAADALASTSASTASPLVPTRRRSTPGPLSRRWTLLFL